MFIANSSKVKATIAIGIAFKIILALQTTRYLCTLLGGALGIAFKKEVFAYRQSSTALRGALGIAFKKEVFAYYKQPVWICAMLSACWELLSKKRSLHKGHDEGREASGWELLSNKRSLHTPNANNSVNDRWELLSKKRSLHITNNTKPYVRRRMNVGNYFQKRGLCILQTTDKLTYLFENVLGIAFKKEVFAYYKQPIIMTTTAIAVGNCFQKRGLCIATGYVLSPLRVGNCFQKRGLCILQTTGLVISYCPSLFYQAIHISVCNIKNRENVPVNHVLPIFDAVIAIISLHKWYKLYFCQSHSESILRNHLFKIIV